MEERIYAILTVPNENMLHALDVCIGDNDTQRRNLAEDELLVKTNQNLIDIKVNSGIGMTKIFPPGLTTYITYEQALTLMSTAEWSAPSEIG